MRIWHQSLAELASLGAYGAALEKRVPTLVSEGTQVDLHGAKPGSYVGLAPADVLRYPVAKHRIHAQVLSCVQTAEAEGYDAFAFASFAEPLLRQARALASIPVTSMLEASLMIGCTMARKVALVTLAPGNRVRLGEQVERHGLAHRVSGIYPLEPNVTEFELAAAFTDPAAILAAFEATAARAVADGADCIIPAEGVLTEVIAAQGINSINGAAVMDCMAVILAWTEMMVHLKRRSGLMPGRAWDHAQTPDAIMAGLDAVLGPL